MHITFHLPDDFLIMLAPISSVSIVIQYNRSGVYDTQEDCVAIDRVIHRVILSGRKK